jgi:phospholipid/cholesterol/gamma-HCH transport system substrate-binding protein
MQSAAKVGVLLLVFIGLVVAGFEVLGHSLFAKPQTTYYAEFADASGLTEGTKILMAGVKVGTVGKIELANANTARLALIIEPTVKIPHGTVATIPSSLIGLGDAPLALIAPTGAIGFESVGATLRGTRASPLDSILPNSKETVAEMTRTLTAVRKLLEDGNLKSDVHQLMASTTTTIDRFGKLADAFQTQLARNQDELHRALVMGTQAVADVQHVTASVVKMLDEGTLQKSAKSILAQLQSTSLKADKLVGSMNDLINDPKLRGPAAQAAKNVADLTESSKAIVANVTEITGTSKSIAVNADKITKNGVAISDNFVGLSEKAGKVADGAIEIEAQLKSLLEKVNGIVGKGGKGPSLPKISGEMSLLRESNPGHFRSDFEVAVPAGKGKVHLGVFDAFEKNGLTVQYGVPFSSSIDVRYGMFAGKPGLGVDYASTSKVGLRTDVWDLNDPRFDARLKFDLGGGFVGWLGLDRVFRDNAPSIGLGVKF